MISSFKDVGVLTFLFLDMGAQSWSVCAEFQLNDRCEWLFGTLGFK